MTAYMDHKNLANEVIDDVRAVQIADGVASRVGSYRVGRTACRS